MGTHGHLLECDFLGRGGGGCERTKAKVGQGIGNPPHTYPIDIPSCNLHSYCLCKKKKKNYILLNLVKNDV